MGKHIKEFKKSIRNMDVFKWILFVTLSIYTLTMFFVLYFGFINSVKSTFDFNRKNVFGFPRQDNILYGWRFSNYVEMFSMFRVQAKPVGQMPRDVYVMEMFVNSLFYSVSMSLFTIATQLMVAYAVAKYNFVGRNFLYNLAIVVMIIPIVGALASEMQFATELHLKDSFIGLCILRCKYPGLYFRVFYAAFKSVSWTYAEAAQIDGAGHLSIFLNLMLPLVSSTITAVFVLQFITNFNDYQTPMLFVPNSPTIAYGLYQYKFNSQTEPPRIIAATMFTCLPIIALFIIFRNKIMGNVNVGGIKG